MAQAADRGTGFRASATVPAVLPPATIRRKTALSSFAHAIDPVRRRLDRLFPGLPDAIGLARHRTAVRTVRARHEIAREGETPATVQALGSGWAAFTRHFPDGRRQIQHLLVPGDLLSLDRRWPMFTTVQALTPVTLIELERPFSPAGTMFDEAMRRSAAFTFQHLLNATARLGRQSAIERFAHLLLELRDRLAAVEIGGDTRFELPLTQEVLADTLGLTSVHVNRTLQAMRQQKLLQLHGREVELLQLDAMRALADYQPVIDG